LPRRDEAVFEGADEEDGHSDPGDSLSCCPSVSVEKGQEREEREHDLDHVVERSKRVFKDNAFYFILELQFVSDVDSDCSSQASAVDINRFIKAPLPLR
jgi:hypothetical protein